MRNKIYYIVIGLCVGATFAGWYLTEQAMADQVGNVHTTESHPGDFSIADIDPNFAVGDWLIYNTDKAKLEIKIWEPPVYKCPKHGETTDVIHLYYNTKTEATAACVQCFLDVFPPLELAVTE